MYCFKKLACEPNVFKTFLNVGDLGCEVVTRNLQEWSNYLVVNITNNHFTDTLGMINIVNVNLLNLRVVDDATNLR